MSSQTTWPCPINTNSVNTYTAGSFQYKYTTLDAMLSYTFKIKYIAAILRLRAGRWRFGWWRRRFAGSSRSSSVMQHWCSGYVRGESDLNETLWEWALIGVWITVVQSADYSWGVWPPCPAGTNTSFVTSKQEDSWNNRVRVKNNTRLMIENDIHILEIYRKTQVHQSFWTKCNMSSSFACVDTLCVHVFFVWFC